ncbi:MAG: autotransporter domain-containing protein [Gammaproteobacteria bacterium]|nr:autotransporter domain-containing protein [Gammaproteobacteria bacterium]
MRQPRPQWKRTAISSAIALAIASFQTPIQAACPGTVNTTENTACNLTAAQSVTITNTGVLDVTAVGTAINVDGLATGVTIDNSGSILADSIGILLQTGHSGTTINNQLGGIITADDAPTVYGVLSQGNFNGTITNAGTINANATSTASVTAYGIAIVGNVSSSSSLTNTGVINVNADANGLFAATAYGIYIDNNLSGTLTNTNTGSINVTGSANSSAANAFGIHVDSAISVSGSLTNSGSILVTVLDSANGPAARGISVRSSVVGSLLNEGDITVNATVDGGNEVIHGIYVGNNVTGNLSNTGTVTLDHQVGSASNTQASGLRISGTLTGTLDNQGSISVNMDGLSDMEAEGIHVSTLAAGGQFLNSGDIEVTTTASGALAEAIGVHMNDMTGGVFINSDTITATATATGNDANASAIYIGNLTGGTLTNDGTISAAAAGVNATAFGIKTDTLDGTLNNSGIIQGTNTDQSLAAGHYSIQVAGGGTGTINNLAGGQLRGDMLLTGTIALNNAGTLVLPTGGGASMGGDYVQSSTGRLELGAFSNTNHASLIVGGTASFSDDANIHVTGAAGNTFALGESLLDVISAGTLSATSFSVTDNFALLNFTAAIDGNTVDLTTVQGLTILEAAILGGSSPAAYGVAGELDNINAGTPTSDMSAILAAMGVMTESEIATTVEQLMPTISGNVGHLTNQIAGVLPDAIDERLNGQRGLSSGDGLMTDHKAWVKPFGNWMEQDDRKGVYGYEADSYGITLGTDADTGAGWRLGAAFAYANSDVDSNDSNLRHQIDMDTYQIGIYANRQMDSDTALDLKAAWGMSNYDSERRIDFVTPVRTASADYDSWHLRLNAKLSREYAVNETTSIAPHLRADYAYVDVDSYRESGAGALNLDVNGDTEDTFILGVGADLNHTPSDNLTIKANLGVGYDISADQSALDAAFVSDGGVFTTHGLDPDPLVLRAGAGVVFANVKNIEITGRYDVEARQDYTNQNVSMNLRWKF